MKKLKFLKIAVLTFVFFLIIACSSFSQSTVSNSIQNSAANGLRVEFNGCQYQLFENSMSWTEAKAYCESLGGQLTSITSDAEQKFIVDLIKKGTKNYYFIGGYCDSDRKFKWVTGEPMVYTAWASGQPDNWQGIQDKILIYRLNNPVTGRGQNMWDDIQNNGTVANEPFFSSGNFGFICKW